MNGLYLAAAGAVAQMGALDLTAQNLANAGTAGYRKFEVVLKAATSANSPYQYAATQTASPPLDMSQGPVRSTGNPLDVALIGPGFLTVQTSDGGQAYTRNGELSLSPDGMLLAAGQPLLQTNGAPLVLPAGPITIAGDGTVSVNGVRSGQLALADGAGATLKALGNSLYGTADGQPLPAVQPDSGTSLRQGFLEQSTGNPLSAMVQMVDIMRSYQSSMSAVQSIDQSSQQAIQTFTLNA